MRIGMKWGRQAVLLLLGLSLLVGCTPTPPSSEVSPLGREVGAVILMKFTTEVNIELDVIAADGKVNQALKALLFPPSGNESQVKLLGTPYYLDSANSDGWHLVFTVTAPKQETLDALKNTLLGLAASPQWVEDVQVTTFDYPTKVEPQGPIHTWG